MFVDIAGYTRLAGRLDAATVDRLVERYFGAFLDEILKRGGDVNETAGDGLMVIFQDADPRRHARAAVATAMALLHRANDINAAEPLDEPIVLHVGVNSGRAGVGATKIEGTAGTRWTYTASGPVTNVAARLAALGDDAIHLGEATVARLPSRVGLEDLGEVSLDLGIRHAHRVLVSRIRVPQTGQHVCDRVGHRHGLMALLTAVSPAGPTAWSVGAGGAQVGRWRTSLCAPRFSAGAWPATSLTW